MRQMLLAGTYRMRDILEQIGYETVRIDDEKLVNINTPEEDVYKRQGYMILMAYRQKSLNR